MKMPPTCQQVQRLLVAMAFLYIYSQLRAQYRREANQDAILRIPQSALHQCHGIYSVVVSDHVYPSARHVL